MNRIDTNKEAPEVFRAYLAFEEVVRKTSLGAPLINLIYTRASMINGCAYCVDSHTHDARKGGETEQRLYALAAWRDTPFFTPKERAALAWTDAVTKLKDGEVPESVFKEVSAHFSAKEIAELNAAVAMINVWNRLGISMAMQPKAR